MLAISAVPEIRTTIIESLVWLSAIFSGNIRMIVEFCRKRWLEQRSAQL